MGEKRRKEDRKKPQEIRKKHYLEVGNNTTKRSEISESNIQQQIH